MRIKQRIPIFLHKMDLRKVLKVYFPSFTDAEIEDIAKRVYPALGRVETSWYKLSDLRFIQILISMGLAPNIPGFEYYLEDEEVLIRIGIPKREVLMWGNNFDKDMNQLSETKWILIKDLTTEHIKAILEGGYAKNPLYKEVFEEELKLREP